MVILLFIFHQRMYYMQKTITFAHKSLNMEDYILREINKIGEILRFIASKLGLHNSTVTELPIAEIKSEFAKTELIMDIEYVLAQKHPIQYLVEHVKISDDGLETFVDILFHSDIDKNKKAELLNDAINFLDKKGYYSFRLHSLHI